MWQLQASNLNATQVAKRWIEEALDGERELLGGQVSGCWTGRTFEGWFHLVHGVRTYRITCGEGAVWTVEPQ